MNNYVKEDIDDSVLKNLAKSYSPLDYSPSLRNKLISIYPGQDFSDFHKHELQQKINHVLLNHHNGESAIKYFLFNKFRNKDLVAAFETRVNKSRADFITINGVSTSYEIKSSLDNLSKLAKQSEDYLQIFEYNYLIIDSRHLSKALQIVPESFGIWLFDSNNTKIYRKPEKNLSINPEMQLNLLTKKEIAIFFGSGNKNIILQDLDKEETNERFKKALKARYRDRWSFLVSNCDQILPIDVQFFFNANIDPKHIYQI